jgi:YVTN family beta-propeller protein
MDAVVAVYPYQTEVGATILAGRAPGFLAASSAPDYLFVANPSSGNVTIINIDSQRVLAVATVGQEPCHIAVTPNNEYALVLNRRSGDVAVLHVGTLTSRKRYSVPILTMVPVGSGPVSAVVRIV